MNKQDEARATDGLLTLTEAARILNVHPVTLKRWARAHKLELVRLPVGNRPRVSRDEIERLMSQTEPTSSEVSMTDSRRAISETLDAIQQVIDSLPAGDPVRVKYEAHKRRLEAMIRRDDERN